jgi:hypothetical protein
MNLARHALTLALASASLCASAAFGLETVLSTNFPGGNIRMIRNRGDTVELAPDLRGGRPWFYWQFEAKAASTGRVRFVFPDAPQLGVQGPAVSVDEGKIWRWLGTNSVRYAGAGQPADKSDSFEFAFTNAQERVRFCSAVPYLPRNLDEFLAGQKGNPHLTVGVLTASTKGQPVELLRVGQAGPGIRAVLVTARHHACESMASYVLEGFLKEALSESPEAAAFRSRYVLYAVPLVDKDGVLAGDQGKGRLPHDHNRDYGPTNLFPEVRAIQALAREKNVELALDFHCPAIRGESHTVFYFDGLIVPPTYDNVKEFSGWLAEEVPPPFSQGPLVWLKKPPVPMPAQGMPFAHYFALQKSVRMAATLEIPYAMSNDRFDAALAREYGKSLLRAWTRMTFVAAGEPPPAGHEAFLAWRKAQGVLIRSRPAEAEKEAGRVLDDTNAPELYRIEARLQRGLLRAAQKKTAEAMAAYGAVAAHDGATARQRAFALTQRALVACGDPALGVDAVEGCLADFLRLRYPAPEQAAQVNGAASAYFERTNRLDRALAHARAQLTAVKPHEKGRILNRLAALHDRLQQPELALQCRLEAVALLRRQLNPVPPGVFGPLMGADLFEALSGISGSTEKEKKAAADIVLKHALRFPDLVQRVSPPPVVTK